MSSTSRERELGIRTTNEQPLTLQELQKRISIKPLHSPSSTQSLLSTNKIVLLSSKGGANLSTRQTASEEEGEEAMGGCQQCFEETLLRIQSESTLIKNGKPISHF